MGSVMSQMLQPSSGQCIRDSPQSLLNGSWQDATVLPIELDTPWYGKGQFTMPAVSGSAVRGKDGIYLRISKR